MAPTKERGHSAILIRYKNENILFDCGEGTQRQFRIAGIKPTKITKILISHWHGDHCLGLPGLIETMGMDEYNNNLKIYGPQGTKQFLKYMFKGIVSGNHIDFDVEEIKKRKLYDCKDFFLEALELKHGPKTFGFSFVEKDKRKIKVSVIKKLGIPEGPLLGDLQNNKPIKWKGKVIKPSQVTYVEKGRKITYVADTSPCKNAVVLAKDADVLICESSFTTEHVERADKYNHMTAKQAGLVANQAGAKKLILTHFSRRYQDTKVLEEDAKSVFDNVAAAYDFMRIKL